MGSHAGDSGFINTLRGNLDLLLKLDEVQGTPFQCVFRTEQELLKDPFSGAPLGSTLTDLYRSIWLQRDLPADLAGRAKAYLLSRLHRWRGPQRRWKSLPAPEKRVRKILLGMLSPRKERQVFIPHIVEAIGPTECHVLTDYSSVQTILPNGTAYSSWNATPGIDHESWRDSVARSIDAWRGNLEALTLEFALPPSARAAILDGLICSSYRFLRYKKLMEWLRPAAVLVEYDRNQRGSCLVLAARSIGIPTLTLVHGVINGPFGYTPALAEKVLCWGELQYKKFVRFGTGPNRVGVVGYVEPGPDLAIKGKELRRRLKVDGDGMLVVLATAPYGQGKSEYLSKMFCEVISRNVDFFGAVRLHPSEDRSAYRELERKFPRIRFLSCRESSLDEVLSAADIVVLHSSGLGTEALARCIPCVVLDTLDFPLGHGEDLVKDGGMPIARNTEELVEILKRLRWDHEYHQSLKENATIFTQYSFAARGQEACRNIAEALKEIVDGSARGVG